MMIEGARRVGKSYIVKEFAQNEYKSYIFIDFFKVGDDIKDLFKNYKNNLDMLFTYLSTYFSTRLYPRESIIVFDEIEFCPAARAAIKYLVEDGRFDYLETGSLLGMIQEYLDTRSFEDTDRVKRQILNLYHKGWRLPLHSALYGALPIKRNDLISYRYIAYMTMCLCLSRFDLEDVLLMIRQKCYFVLHAPRQTGKTSCMLAYATI